MHVLNVSCHYIVGVELRGNSEGKSLRISIKSDLSKIARIPLRVFSRHIELSFHLG